MGGVDVSGYVAVHKTVTAASDTERGRTTYEYAITMTDGNHGIRNLTLEGDVSRSSVLTSGAGNGRINPEISNNRNGYDKFGDTYLHTYTGGSASLSADQQYAKSLSMK